MTNIPYTGKRFDYITFSFEIKGDAFDFEEIRGQKEWKNFISISITYAKVKKKNTRKVRVKLHHPVNNA